MLQREQRGLSQVPLLFPATFQSQSRSARRPQAQRRPRLDEQTIAAWPFGSLIESHVMPACRMYEPQLPPGRAPTR